MLLHRYFVNEKGKKTFESSVVFIGFHIIVGAPFSPYFPICLQILITITSTFRRPPPLFPPNPFCEHLHSHIRWYSGNSFAKLSTTFSMNTSVVFCWPLSLLLTCCCRVYCVKFFERKCVYRYVDGVANYMCVNSLLCVLLHYKHKIYS